MRNSPENHVRWIFYSNFFRFTQHDPRIKLLFPRTFFHVRRGLGVVISTVPFSHPYWMPYRHGLGLLLGKPPRPSRKKILKIKHFINCKCMCRFDTSGTSKNETLTKVSVHHGMKKYVNKIYLLYLLTEIWLFVYILWQYKK